MIIICFIIFFSLFHDNTYIWAMIITYVFHRNFIIFSLIKIRYSESSHWMLVGHTLFLHYPQMSFSCCSLQIKISLRLLLEMRRMQFMITAHNFLDSTFSIFDILLMIVNQKSKQNFLFGMFCILIWGDLIGHNWQQWFLVSCYVLIKWRKRSILKENY